MLNKGSLGLLQTYGSDSSDEDVPILRVSTKRQHESENEKSYKKQCTRLPIPNIILKGGICNVDHLDNPMLHDGRIRSFAHERGNWATFLYIPFNEDADIRKVLQMTFTENIPGHIEIKEIENFHISVTKTVILKHHWISSFIESVKTRMSSLRKFLVLFDDLKVFCNEERTRTFIGLKIRTGFDSLAKLVSSLDYCLQEFNLPLFYKDPSFHMSIAWCIGDHEKELNMLIPLLNHKLQVFRDGISQDSWYIYVDSLFCKIGNKYFEFHLN